VPRERAEMRESAGIRRDAPGRESRMPDERVDNRESVTRLLKEKRNEVEHESEEPDTRSRPGARGPHQRALETERGHGCRGRRLPTCGTSLDERRATKPADDATDGGLFKHGFGPATARAGDAKDMVVPWAMGDEGECPDGRQMEGKACPPLRDEAGDAVARRDRRSEHVRPMVGLFGWRKPMPLEPRKLGPEVERTDAIFGETTREGQGRAQGWRQVMIEARPLITRQMRHEWLEPFEEAKSIGGSDPMQP
jgi:hypothetical protein